VLIKQAVKLILEWNLKGLSDTLLKFIDLKKKIRKTLINYPIANIYDQATQEILRKIQQENPFQADKIIKVIEQQTDEPIEYDKLEFDEIEELSDLFYSWFSHYEYLEAEVSRKLLYCYA